MQHTGEHRPNEFTPVVSAMELADHVILITDNANKFPDFSMKRKKNEDGTVTEIYIQRQDSLVNWVRDQAKQIFVLLYTANKINLNNEPWRKAERLGNQLKAISLCEEHMATIQLCRKHFHLSAKKIEYWGGLALKVKNSTQKWHESDKRRYSAA